MKTKAIILLTVFIIFFNCSFSRERAFFSPGLKIGYELDKKAGGWTFGIELSYVFIIDNNLGGVVFNLDFLNNNRRKIFIGIEYLPFPAYGITAGTSFLFENNKFKDYGINIIPFAGFVGYLYLDYSIFLNNPNIVTMGMYLKVPFLFRSWYSIM